MNDEQAPYRFCKVLVTMCVHKIKKEVNNYGN